MEVFFVSLDPSAKPAQVGFFLDIPILRHLRWVLVGSVGRVVSPLPLTVSLFVPAAPSRCSESWENLGSVLGSVRDDWGSCHTGVCACVYLYVCVRVRVYACTRVCISVLLYALILILENIATTLNVFFFYLLCVCVVCAHACAREYVCACVCVHYGVH